MNNNDDIYNYGVLLIYSFIIGLLFAQFAAGFFFIIISIVLFEIFTASKCRMKAPWSISRRIGVIVMFIFGFFLGRIAIRDDHPFRLWCKQNSMAKTFINDDD